jgi:hypothetical protein
MSIELLFQLPKKIVGIAEESQIGLIEVGLQNAISAIECAVYAKVQDAIPAAEIMPRSRTRLEKAAAESDYFQSAGILLALGRDTIHESHFRLGQAFPERLHKRAISDLLFDYEFSWRINVHGDVSN